MTKITIVLEDTEDGDVAIHTDVKGYDKDSNAQDLAHRISIFLIEETGMESIMEPTGLENVMVKTLPASGSGG